MSGAAVTEHELTALVRQTAEAAAALISGGIRRYFALAKHADDFTLVAPFGGEPNRGSDTPGKARSDGTVLSRRRGESGTCAVLHLRRPGGPELIERLHGDVGGMPDQGLSLRVTLVYRREGQQCRLVHRHADPVVHGIGLERLAALARGD